MDSPVSPVTRTVPAMAVDIQGIKLLCLRLVGKIFIFDVPWMRA
jgi:hypothetical protein